MVSRCLFAIAFLAVSPSFAQFPNETERLMSTARLWVTVEYFHPYLAYRDIDWDQALVTALPKIRRAANAAEYRTAISEMLAELHDEQTYVLPARPPVSSQIVNEPASPQVSVVHTATESASLIRMGGPQTIFVDLTGIVAAVRLSAPDAVASIPGTTAGAIPRTPFVSVPSQRYSDPYPPTEARLLAAIKTWGAIHYFFAYKDLIDEDWDEVFASYLPKFIEAHDAVDYNLAFADLLTHLTDTNTAPHSETLDTYFGAAPVGLRIRLLDKYPIITDVLDPAATEAGVRPGDVVKRVGNESITDRFHRFVQYVPASTPQRSGYDTIQRIANGPPGTDIDLTIENAQGEFHAVKLTRKPQTVPQRTGEPVRTLPGNFGYLDLDRLAPDAAENALHRLKDTRAIILDLRGHAPAAAAVAAHLTSNANVAAALVTTLITLHPDIPTAGVSTQTTSTFVVRTLPAPQAPLYQGKTIALIDERTIAEAEYAGLLFEAANRTEFVGMPSAGAESAIAELKLPGNITVTYSTQDVRHANGGKLQRLGLQPNISIPTTAKGLRAGRDEALEAALSSLSNSSSTRRVLYSNEKEKPYVRNLKP